jgi:UDP-glucuronate decarboxylase
MTMNELAAQVLELVGGDSAIEYRPLPADDPVQRQPNIELANQVLDWRPSVGLDQGLKQTVDYFRALTAAG